ncbi:TadE/TadG family type IV pilus assembly protein [Nocardioides sp. YIM B13467]|uniref:TadE/TadG family type IV pilus assembly protein n=1 Tax=Nocardioides sp. YIM B13467 TaxID=3366294 RepID=UPI0036721739
MARGTSSRDERGAASIEMVILLPALFAVLFLGLQAALYFHARTIAIAAAQEGARAAAADQAGSQDGVIAARAYLADAGDSLESSRASARRTATTATVTVRGRALSVIPGWKPAITQHASAEVERLTAPGEPR